MVKNTQDLKLDGNRALVTHIISLFHCGVVINSKKIGNNFNIHFIKGWLNNLWYIHSIEHLPPL